MNIDTIKIEKVENGVVVEYWEEAEQKKKAFIDLKKLIEFIKKHVDMK